MITLDNGLDHNRPNTFSEGMRVPSETGAGVYVAVLDTGLLKTWRAYFPAERIATEFGASFGGGGGEVAHLEHRPVAHVLAGAGDPHRLGAQRARLLRRRDEHGAAVVGDEADVEQVQRPRDQAAVQDVLDRDRPAEGMRLARVHDRARVERGPVARGHGDLREVFLARAPLVHVPRHRVRVVGGRAGDAVGDLELARHGPLVVAQRAVGAVPAVLARGVARLAVRDQRDVDDAGVDRGERVVRVQDEGGAADGRGVDVLRVDAQVLGQLRREARGEDALDLRGLDAGLLADVVDRLDVEAGRGCPLLDVADAVRLGGADDLRAPLGDAPASPEERIRRFQKKFWSTLLNIVVLFVVNLFTGRYVRVPWFLIPSAVMLVGLGKRIAGMVIDGILSDQEGERAARLLAPESGHPRRVRARVERELQQEARDADDGRRIGRRLRGDDRGHGSARLHSGRRSRASIIGRVHPHSQKG